MKTCTWLILAMIAVNEFVLQLKEPALSAVHFDVFQLGLSDICICLTLITVVAKFAQGYLQIESREARVIEGQSLINRLCSDVFVDEEEFGPAMVLIRRNDD